MPIYDNIKQNNKSLSISNVSKYISNTNIKCDDKLISGDTYYENFKNYMKKAFTTIKNPEDVNVVKIGYRPRKSNSCVVSCNPGSYDLVCDSSGSKSINGINISSNRNDIKFKDVFVFSLCGGGGSGAVGSSTKSGGGGAAAGGCCGVLTFNETSSTKLSITVGSGANGVSKKGSAGNRGSDSYIDSYSNSDSHTRILTCYGGSAGNVNGSSSGGSVSLDTNVSTTRPYIAYGITISGGNGGSPKSDGGSISYSNYSYLPEGESKISMSGGSCIGSRGGGGGASAFGDGTNGYNADTSSPNAEMGAGSGGTGYIYIGTPKSTGKGGNGLFNIDTY